MTGRAVPQPRAVVMADVARLASVSQQTVSRVLNDSPHVRPATRERVLDAIGKPGYRPNRLARALVTGRSRTLGVLSFDTTLYGPASTLYAIERAAHEAGYFVSIASLRAPDAPSLRLGIERLLEQGVEGVLVIAPLQAAGRGGGGAGGHPPPRGGGARVGRPAAGLPGGGHRRPPAGRRPAGGGRPG